MAIVEIRVYEFIYSFLNLDFSINIICINQNLFLPLEKTGELISNFIIDLTSITHHALISHQERKSQ